MISTVRERLKSYSAKKVECASTIMAGVVIPLFEKDGDFFFLLTKRSDKVRFHKGEVSFPGGMYEETDGNILKYALRECSEEIGLKRDDVEIIGRLMMFTRSPVLLLHPMWESYRTPMNSGRTRRR